MFLLAQPPPYAWRLDLPHDSRTYKWHHAAGVEKDGSPKTRAEHKSARITIRKQEDAKASRKKHKDKKKLEKTAAREKTKTNEAKDDTVNNDLAVVETSVRKKESAKAYRKKYNDKIALQKTAAKEEKHITTNNGTAAADEIMDECTGHGAQYREFIRIELINAGARGNELDDMIEQLVDEDLPDHKIEARIVELGWGE